MLILYDIICTGYSLIAFQIVELRIPHLEPMKIAHVITILSEMATGMDKHHEVDIQSNTHPLVIVFFL